MKELLIKLNACKQARDWAGDKTIEEVVNTCHRGDWLLWLAKKVELDDKLIILTAGHCANTVRHLMVDERSIKCVDGCISYGDGKISKQELVLLRSAASTAANAAYAANAAAAAANAANAANDENKMITADICRKYIGQLIIDKCNELNTKEK